MGRRLNEAKNRSENIEISIYFWLMVWKLLLVSIFIIDYSFCKKNLNRITRGREQIVNLIFVRMMDKIRCDLELTYKK